MSASLHHQPLRIPYEGEIFVSPQRQYEETVVLVNHFGGSKRALRRHQEWLAEIGFNSVVFQLSYQSLFQTPRLPVTYDLKFGIVDVWAEEIHRVLAALPGQKILYSFSFPSAAALRALVERRSFDVRAWVCEGGPFLQAWKAFWNFTRRDLNVDNPILRASMTSAMYILFGGEKLSRDIREDMQALPKDFPVLSVRYWQDQLVAIGAIDQVFNAQDPARLEILSLPEGDHLQGLLKCPDEYKDRIGQFLARNAQSLTERPT